MLEIPEDRCERAKLFKAIDDAFRAGDFEGLGLALGGSERWVDEKMPFELGLGHPLEYAIYWSPAAFIEKLIKSGSNPNYGDDGGFHSIIAALSTNRSDKLEIVQVLLNHGADPDRRGVNDWTPLHYAVSIRDLSAMSLLLTSGADPRLRTRIDDYSTALEEAQQAGFEPEADLLRKAMNYHQGSSHGEPIESGETENDLVWRWHDNLVYGIRFDLGDPEKQDWRSNLVFDIDFIVEWLREPSDEYRFRVAPATLTFHDVADLSILISQGSSDGRNAMTECSIDSVTRKRLDRTFDFWHWTIKLNMPAEGKIEFCASGYSQTLRAAPRVVTEQRLPRGERHG